MKLPKTRLSTPMSGSARATEGRIRNLFVRHRRPALWLLAAVAALICLCGGLVACRSQEGAMTLIMDTQYYDALENYIEIPRLTAADGPLPDGARAVNQALEDLSRQYQTVMAAPMNQVGGSRCICYPAVTERYDNLVFYLGDTTSSGNDGTVYSLVYDRQEDRLVTQEEALELAGTTLETLYQGAMDALNGEIGTGEPAVAAQDPRLVGFRIRRDGGVDFYLTCMADDADPAMDILDGWQHLLVCADGAWRHYNCHAALLKEEPLIPAEELEAFEPPLWYQWGPAGEQPEGGFALARIPEQVESQAQAYLEGQGYHVSPDSLLLRARFDDLSGLALAQEWQDCDALECYRLLYTVSDTQRAVDLLFFRRGGDYMPVGELTEMDYDSVEPTRLASVGRYNVRVMYDLLERGILTAFPDWDSMLRDAPLPQEARSALLIYDYGRQSADEQGRPILFADQVTSRPEEGTVRIDRAEYVGLQPLYETCGVVYEVERSRYEAGAWTGSQPVWVVLELDQSGSMDTVLGSTDPSDSVEMAVMEQGYHLMDGEVSLWRDGYPTPTGIGGCGFPYFDESPVVVYLDLDPVYREGEFWRGYEWEDFTALAYCNADYTVFTEYWNYDVYRIDTTRTDLATYRGIRVGSTREEVEAAYGDKLYDTDYWGLYPGEDYLWYCGNPDGWGAAIVFFFDGDRVSRMVLNHMFD